jgi:hypothetical protein
MASKAATFCPLIRKDCVEHRCAWYVQIRGVDPNNGQELNQFGCAVAWMPLLAIENAQQGRQTGAAVESFRNEMVTANESNRAVLMASAQLVQHALHSASEQ